VNEWEYSLVSRTIAGEINAFRSIMSSRQSLVFSLAFYWTGDEARAKDLCTETFRSAYMNIERVRQEDSLPLWLKAILDSIAVQTPPPPRKKSHDPAFGTRQNLRNPLYARELINSLPDDLRLVLTLSHYEDVDRSEIAEAIAVTEEEVEKLLSKAEEALTDILEKPGITQPH